MIIPRNVHSTLDAYWIFVHIEIHQYTVAIFIPYSNQSGGSRADYIYLELKKHKIPLLILCDLWFIDLQQMIWNKQLTWYSDYENSSYLFRVSSLVGSRKAFMVATVLWLPGCILCYLLRSTFSFIHCVSILRSFYNVIFW